MKEFLRTALKIVLFVVVLWVLWQVALGVFVGEKNYDLHVSLDGKKVEADGTVYYQSGVMARLDWLAEVMGAELEQEGGKFTLRLGEDELVLKLRSSEAVLNGERYKLAAASVKKRGQVWVHARTVAEAFGWAVVYRDGVLIYTPEYLAKEEREKPEVIFNGEDVTQQLGPQMQGGICYVRLDDLINLLSVPPLAEYPIYEPANGKGQYEMTVDGEWQHKLTYFTTYDYQELAEIDAIVVWPHSNAVLIKRGNQFEGVEMEHNVIYNPRISGKTMGVYKTAEPLEFVDGGTDFFTSDFFKGKLEIDGCRPLMIPAAEFVPLLLPGAEVEFDSYGNTLTINCEGSY